MTLNETQQAVIELTQRGVNPHILNDVVTSMHRVMDNKSVKNNQLAENLLRTLFDELRAYHLIRDPNTSPHVVGPAVYELLYPLQIVLHGIHDGEGAQIRTRRVKLNDRIVAALGQLYDGMKARNRRSLKRSFAPNRAHTKS